MARRHLMLRRMALPVILALLAGCSGMRIVDSDVQAYTTRQGVTAPMTYRFERTPSQQARGARQDRL